MLNIPKNDQRNVGKQRGFSLVELVIVMLIVSILSVLALISFKGEKKYLADSQAYLIIDILSEARQRSLTQRETMRVEIDQTRNIVRLIAENEPGTADDDKVIKTLTLQDAKSVVVGAIPSNVSSPPTEMTLTPVITFKKSIYPLSINDMVATLRFVRTGKVLDAGSNAIGDNSVPTGATIYVWMPNGTSGQLLTTGSVIRAITVQATTGISHYLKCPVINAKCTDWGP